MSKISTTLDPETMLKLTRRAARVNMTPPQAAQVIATKGVRFFLGLLVGATKPAARDGKGVQG